MESGSTAQIDAMLEGKNATEGPARVTMTLSYEDESGNVSTSEQELQLEVTEQMEEEMMPSDMGEESQGGFPVVPVIVVLLIAIAIAAVVIWRKRKQKKQAQGEEEELLNELERSSEDER